MWKQALSPAATALLSLLLMACAVVPPGPGTTETKVLREWGTPTARHALPGGALRLEYATGPFGRTTWMLDLNTAGRVTNAQQVLAEPALWALQPRLPGMARAELLQTLGTPGERRSGGRQGGEIWSWRYETNECLWFRVSIADDARVQDGGFYPDPSCDNGPKGF